VSEIPTEAPPVQAAGGRRVQARVALVLLETLKSADRPGEVLDDENVTLTIPRRLGLSGVVEAQIQRYRQEARLGGRIAEQEILDLLRLVTRRPDSEDVFVEIGRSLTAASAAPPWRRILPRRIAFGMARRRVVRRLRVLFDGAVVAAAGSPFVLENVDDLLMQADPGGEACGLVTGLSQAILGAAGVEGDVRHVSCRGRGDEGCRWEVAEGTGQGAREDEDDESNKGSEE
jgi:hypothetical protein